jgi:membrane protein YqaA with SNARE-associated domain
MALERMPMSLSPSSDSPSHSDLSPIWPVQAILGLILGGVVSFWLIVADPFRVVSFTLPQGVDSAVVAAAYDEWKSSGRVIIGSLAMTFIPLLVSGVCGVFTHRSLPSSISVALLRMTGVASLLLLVSTVGSRVIDHALSTGESSDIQTPVAMLAFEAFCVSLTAPLSSMVTRRRSRGEGRALAKAPRNGSANPA